jgi:asparagine synthase (glutamine-hydrolysing)
MSAIAGIFRTDGRPVDRREIDRMAVALAHRGSNGGPPWCRDSIALAQRAVWTTPEAVGEAQPVRVGGSVIVADARLDNRQELVEALGVAGAGALGDAALILHAYLRWGEACATRLIGDFAFAIWDGRERRLFCARDHVGVKPLYYHHGTTALLFASEIKALFTSPLTPYALDRQRVADYLVARFDDEAATFYKDIQRLPAGHTLTAWQGGGRIYRYWSLDRDRELTLGSDAAYAEAFRECFTKAVRCRLRSHGVVGSLLSGGLDSSSIVATARDIRTAGGDGPLDTFTAIFPGLSGADLRGIDERGFVEAVVGQGGVRSHYMRGDVLSPLGDADRALWHLDEPFAAPNLYLHWGLYRTACDHGVTTLLDGIDGDTTVSHGLERLPALARSGKAATLVRELRALSRRYRVGMGSVLWQYALRPLVPEAAAHWMRRVRRQGAPCLAQSVIRPDFARQTAVAERAQTRDRSRAVDTGSPRAAHWRAMTSGLIPYTLELADKAAAAFGVEPRYPFFDRRLMELCLGLPVDQKLRDGWTRSIMRRAMDGLLPDRVRWRAGKANLAPNFRQRLMQRDGRVIRDVLDRPGSLDEFVDIPALRRAYDRCLTQATDADTVTVFTTSVLGLWLERAKLG